MAFDFRNVTKTVIGKTIDPRYWIKYTMEIIISYHAIKDIICTSRDSPKYKFSHVIYQSWASPQIRICGLTKKVANMRTCGLWQLKLRSCGCGLFLILVRNSASFIQILKFLSIFVKYLCFYLVKH